MGGMRRQRNRLREGGGAIHTGFEHIEKARKIDGPPFCHVGQCESLGACPTLIPDPLARSRRLVYKHYTLASL